MQALAAARRLVAAEAFSSLIARVDAAISPGIRDYLSFLEGFEDRRVAKPKAFKDSLWGMIDLSGPELTILDSPPLQRLRRIKQLGFTELTYHIHMLPSATTVLQSVLMQGCSQKLRLGKQR
jgi:hypothetical protein